MISVCPFDSQVWSAAGTDGRLHHLPADATQEARCGLMGKQEPTTQDNRTNQSEDSFF